MTGRECRLCKTRKPLSEFDIYSESNGIVRRRFWCRLCYKPKYSLKEKIAKKDAWRKLNPDARFGEILKRSYGMTREEYARLLAAQNGLCAICSRPPKDGKRLVVDHDHTTKKIRGLLCQQCNVMLGMAADNLLVLESAKQYLCRTK